jgi:hypothetical protein
MARIPNNSTSIDHLFDLEEDEKNVNKYQRFMKGTVDNSYMSDPIKQYEQQGPSNIHTQHPSQHLSQHPSNNLHRELDIIPEYHNQKYNLNNFNDNCEATCKSVLKHVKECEICMKFYNNDKSIYIILLILFGLIIVILLKKVMES